MTKETKIGLLVGLAFIILFAIILSEKGATRGTTAPSGLRVADASSSSPRPTGQDRPLSQAGRLPVERGLTPGAQPSSPRATDAASKQASLKGQAVPEDGQAIPPLPQSLVEYLNQDVGGDEEMEGQVGPGGGEATLSLEEAVAQAAGPEGQPRETSQKTEPATVVQATPQPSGTVANGPATVAPEAGSPRTNPSSPPRETGVAAATPRGGDARESGKPGGPTVIKAMHVVKPGESLGKIAAAHYGRATPERIQAIFEANQDVLKDMHKVRAEDKLKIPALGEAQDQFEAAPQFAPAVIISPQPAAPRHDQRVRIPIPVGDGVEKQVAAGSAGQSGVRQAERKIEGGAQPGPPSGAPAGAQYRWYVVQKKDTLASIARRELGTERRHDELYRLNQDIVKDKNVIKPGMKIRLPAGPRAEDAPAVVSTGGSDRLRH